MLRLDTKSPWVASWAHYASESDGRRDVLRLIRRPASQSSPPAPSPSTDRPFIVALIGFFPSRLFSFISSDPTQRAGVCHLATIPNGHTTNGHKIRQASNGHTTIWPQRHLATIFAPVSHFGHTIEVNIDHCAVGKLG